MLRLIPLYPYYNAQRGVAEVVRCIGYYNRQGIPTDEDSMRIDIAETLSSKVEVIHIWAKVRQLERWQGCG